jgi:hypothetical protein
MDGSDSPSRRSPTAKYTHGCCCCGRLQLWLLLLLWPITTRPVVYETVRSCMASCRLTTSRCTLDVVLLRETSAQSAMLVNKATRWCLGFVDVPRPWQARVHAIGAAIHLRMVMLSCIGEVLCTAADGAMRGDSLRASQGLNLCKSLTGLLGPDALPTATARKCHISTGLALVWVAPCHDACLSCL